MNKKVILSFSFLLFLRPDDCFHLDIIIIINILWPSFKANSIITLIIIMPPTTFLSPHTVRCTQDPDTGGCRDSFTKWYYDPFQQECLRFNFGGCNGNDNRFESQESCRKFCRGVTGW